MAKKIPRENLIDEIKRLNELLDRPPSSSDLKKYSGLSLSTFKNEFGTWSKALEAVGLEPRDLKKALEIPKQELMRDFERLGDELGRTPTASDVDEMGEYSPSTYANRFESWREMVSQSKHDNWEMPAGEEHPAWKGGTHRINYGKGWGKQREKALKRDDHQCRLCGLTNDEHKEQFQAELHVHHVTPAKEFDDDRLKNRLDNLLTLCASCHKKWEGIPLKPDR